MPDGRGTRDDSDRTGITEAIDRYVRGARASLSPVRTRALLLLFGSLVACSPGNPNARETSGEKSEWSILQSAEFAARSTRVAAPSVCTVQGYELLVVPGEKQNIWVMLNPKSPPYYKQLPSGRYSLPVGFVEHLAREQQVGYTVEQVLRSLMQQQ